MSPLCAASVGAIWSRSTGLRSPVPRATAGEAISGAGRDIPRIGRGDVARAFRSLGRAEATLGPSGDGGYWLVGLRRLRPQPPDLFAGVRWSGPYAYDDTLATLPAGWRIGQEPVLEDVDTGGDYHRLMGTLAAREVRS
jgi:glycosyltransferase A (GT-A) superfamily protein (DUF2064 family)